MNGIIKNIKQTQVQSSKGKIILLLSKQVSFSNERKNISTYSNRDFHELELTCLQYVIVFNL